MPQKIKLVAVGKIKDRRIRECVSEYQKRIGPFARLDIIELSDDSITNESKKINEYVKDNPECTFIMDSRGKGLTSEEFARLINLNREKVLTMVVGGPDGIDDSVKKSAKLVSLSRMTFTHEMARLFLIEQIYRACMINNNRKYHK